MTTPIVVTRGYRGHTPGTVLDLPDGIAASMIAAGLARRPTPPSTQTTPQTSDEPRQPDKPDHEQPDSNPTSAPPRAGPGSTKAAWITYAASVGVDVQDDMTRDEVITTIDATWR